jgi:intracellular multiplication protein IcmK
MIRFIQYMKNPAKLLLVGGLALFYPGSFAANGDANAPPALNVSTQIAHQENVAANTTPAASAPAPASAPANTGALASSPIAQTAKTPAAMPIGVAPIPAPGVDVSAATVTPSANAELIDPALFGTTRDPSFENMTTKMFPMSPEQIEALHQVYDATQSAIAAPATSPKPMLSSQTVSLSPGSVPPVIRLATGYVSSILFLDETGMPWPITSYNMGDPKSFNVQWDQESNILMIQGQGPYSTGNMGVTLEGLSTPMMLTLVSDQRVVDYRVDFRIQGRGPKAAASMYASASKTGSALLMNLLDGVAPQDARPLEVVGGGAQAWLRGDVMFLRTPLTLLSPSYDATMSSADGTKVYQMTATPLVLVSDRGRSTTITIKGL